MPDAARPPLVPRPDDLPAGAGTVRPIRLHPDPVLRAICAAAGELKYPELRALVADLFATLYAAGGRGLAAPQIGIARRVFVMDAGWKDGIPAPLAVIEPQIVSRSRKTAIAPEQCLSIPDHPVRVRRLAEIRLAFFDLAGNACELALEGAAARIAQHELDHLDGILILDADPALRPDPLPGKAPVVAGKTARLVARARAGRPPPRLRA